MNDHAQLLVGFSIGAAIPLFLFLIRLVAVSIEEGEALLITRFGRLAEVISRAGWTWVPDWTFPWVQLHRVSLRRQYEDIGGVIVNDVHGTTVLVDVFLEYRVVDPAQALFAVDDREAALKHVVSHSVLSLLGNRTFQEILHDRTVLGTELQEDLKDDLERWGLRLERVLIRGVQLLPEISRQIARTVAAQLERARARIEEHGKQKVHLLEAQTAERTASLEADAHAQYPLAVGRAYSALKRHPAVFAAFSRIHELSLMRPGRMVAFRGFGNDGSLRPADAAMMGDGHLNLRPQLPQTMTATSDLA
jgi:regulator of protease activity HflC (stomatin/prohibitin superfamily)